MRSHKSFLWRQRKSEGGAECLPSPLSTSASADRKTNLRLVRQPRIEFWVTHGRGKSNATRWGFFYAFRVPVSTGSFSSPPNWKWSRRSAPKCFSSLLTVSPVGFSFQFQLHSKDKQTSCGLLRPADHMQVLGPSSAATGFHATLTLRTKGSSQMEQEHFKARWWYGWAEAQLFH